MPQDAISHGYLHLLTSILHNAAQSYVKPWLSTQLC